jgi:hypothetical protein
MVAYSGAKEAHEPPSVVVGTYLGAMEAHPSAIEANPRVLEADPSAVQAHLGVTETQHGISSSCYVDSSWNHLGST